jgi:PRTRC genetic system ThiF family protein
MYRLYPHFSESNMTIAVVGCGGTGGFLAEGLCRLLQGTRCRLVLVDHDRVEEHNLLRQSFYPEDLGNFKAQALAERLALRFRRPVAYALDPFSSPMEESSALGPGWASLRPGILVGCVDNAPAREAMAQWTERWHSGWWVDVGNGEHFGQVLVGNAPPDKLRGAFREGDQVCIALPRPTDQRPELLAAPELPQGEDCAEAVEAGRQSPTINQAMAALALEVVRRLVEENCSWMQVSLDLEAGTMHPTYATPEAVSRMTGIPLRVLVAR